MRHAEGRFRSCQPRLGLGHVGAGHLAHVEAVAGGAQQLAHGLDVLLLQLENGAVAQHVHVGGDAVQEHVLFGITQRLARGQNLGLGGTGKVPGLESVEQRLPRGDAVAARVQVALGDSPAGKRRAAPRVADIGIAEDLRPVAGKRLGHLLVGGAVGGALGVEGGVIMISVRERAFDRLAGPARAAP